MKTLFLDVMLNDRFVCTLKYKFCPLFPIELGLAGALGVDFDKMNPCKYHRAFDKFTFTENAFALTKGLCRDIIGIEKRIQFGLEYVTKWAKSINIDLDWHIDEKMKYNATRPPKHEKAY